MSANLSPAERPAIAHVITSLERGGAQAMLARLVARPGRFRHLVYSLMDEGAFGEELTAAGAEVRSVRLHKMDAAPGGLHALLLSLHRARPVVLHGWMYHGCVAAWSALKVLNLPAGLVWGVRQTLYEVERESTSTRFAIRAMARLSKDPDAITYNSEIAAVQHEAVGFSPRARIIIDNGFDIAALDAARARRDAMRAAWGVEDDETLIGLVARVHPMKGHAVFLAAAERLIRTHPRLKFLLSGAGTADGPSVAGVSPSEELSHRLLRLGEQPNGLAVSAALDVAVSASVRGEGFSNAVGEAMGAGVPAIVTDVGDGPRVLGDAGLVCAPNDADALAAALARMIELGPQERARLGAVGAERVRAHFSITAAASAHEALYHRVMEARRRGALTGGAAKTAGPKGHAKAAAPEEHPLPNRRTERP